MGKNDLNILLATKMLRKLDLNMYFYPKWVDIEKTLMKLNICFLIKKDELLEKYNENWEKVKNIKKEFGSEPVYNQKYLKAKIKP